MAKKSDELYDNAMNDFISKIPDINSYDFWFRLSQTIIQSSNENETTKTISQIVANAIVNALDKRNKK